MPEIFENETCPIDILSLIKSFPFSKNNKNLGVCFNSKEKVVRFTNFETTVVFPTPKEFETVEGVFSFDKIIKLSPKFSSFTGKGSNLIFSNPGEMFIKPIASMDDGYSALPEQTEEEILFTCKVSDLKQAVNFCKSCASEEDSRRYLNGLFFDKINKCVVSTDGRRLAKKDFPFFCTVGEYSPIIPLTIFTYLEKVFSDEEEIWCRRIADNTLLFEIGCVKIYQATIDGRFPNWEQVVPKSELLNGRIHFDKEMIAGIKNIQSMKYEKGKFIPCITIYGDSNGIELSVRSTDFKEEWGHFSLKCKEATLTDLPIDITLSSKFIMDAIEVFPTKEKLLMHYQDHSLKPVVFTTTENYYNDYIIIMPAKKED